MIEICFEVYGSNHDFEMADYDGPWESAIEDQLYAQMMGWA